jgi:hypothetical protein
MDYTKLITIAELLKKATWLKEGTVRMWIFNPKLYDFQSVLYQQRKGGRILINEEEFDKWVKRRNIMAPVKS